MERAKLTGWQMFTLTYLFTIGTSFILMIGELVSDAKQFSWVVLLWSGAAGLAPAWLWLRLYGRFPGRSLVQIAIDVFGKWGGGVVAALYVWYFIQIAGWTARILSDFMSINLMPRTPLTAFNLVLLAVCAYAVVKGIEAIAMVGELVVGYIVLAYWLTMTIMFREWEWANFGVPFDFELWRIVAETKYMTAIPFMEPIALAMLFPYVQRRLHAAFLGGLASAVVVLAAGMYCTIGILGVNRASHLLYPFFVLFREVELFGFLEHFEAIIAVNILLLVCVKLSIAMYCAVSGVCQLFELRSRASVAYPMIWIVSAYALLFANVTEQIHWFERYAFGYFAAYAVVLPLLLLAVARLRGARRAPTGGTAP